ncbi:hypothetical protein J3459_010793 [Metarhizium acridum]|nr:hypothetical protein J3459_010793 [Metarhizium acridum]
MMLCKDPRFSRPVPHDLIFINVFEKPPEYGNRICDNIFNMYSHPPAGSMDGLRHRFFPLVPSFSGLRHKIPEEIGSLHHVLRTSRHIITHGRVVGLRMVERKMSGLSKDVLTKGGTPNAFFRNRFHRQLDQALHSLKLLVQLSVHDTGYFGDKSMLGEAT